MFQRQGKAAYKANLDNTLALDKQCEHPHKKYVTVHIAGTNGKGSVSHFLASILQAAGFKTGLYTSPHLKDFRERIKVNGEMIEKDAVVKFVGKHKDFFAELKPSFFEMTVAMAFDYFAEEEVDIAIIETGLGGRLDSTNIVNPVVSVITNISIDHTQFLGETIDVIAEEKAGIIKEKTPVVIGECNDITRQIFTNKAREKNAPIYFTHEVYNVDYSYVTIDKMRSFDIFRNGEKFIDNLKTELLGEYQKKNIVTVLQTVELLQKADWEITEENIYEGVLNVVDQTGLLGRWQILEENPKVICDTAHNIEGVETVIKQLIATPHKNLHIVFGVVNDKKIDAILKLLPRNAIYYFTKASIPRALGEKQLASKAKRIGLHGEHFPTVKEALDKAKENAEEKDIIFVGGSTFVVADVLNFE